ncbi:lipoyl protein ligase domain-containing protein [Paenibacillus hexagrammi]|uniref:BPL/LPL catalytic domain-containing protein n=1 Tax=Paenibacillus hexagrammi TaxID=2908839 RepID=A0ABY3SFH9_9BACL|nr:hypothetical protein [Paenibacillus sp. YPD9-1]UJF31936.1 hypothetical protein L0M14_19555 [Paenibacillus sp. YPD9-1]
MMTVDYVLPPDTMIWDRSGITDRLDILTAFALEELLCRTVGQGASPLVHIWRHPRAFVMGLRDSRLPQASAAAEWLQSQGYVTAVRNSGGAAVPLDLGVVNVSLILPKPAGDMEHRKDFELMVSLLRKVMGSLSQAIDQGEIIGSFCPGEFDLSVGGKSFAGSRSEGSSMPFPFKPSSLLKEKGKRKPCLPGDFTKELQEERRKGIILKFRRKVWRALRSVSVNL